VTKKPTDHSGEPDAPPSRSQEEIEQERREADDAVARMVLSAQREAQDAFDRHAAALARVIHEERVKAAGEPGPSEIWDGVGWRLPLSDFAPPPSPPPRLLPSNHPSYPYYPTAAEYPGLSIAMRSVVRGLENKIRLAPTAWQALRAAAGIRSAVNRLSEGNVGVIASKLQLRAWRERWAEPGKSVVGLLCLRLRGQRRARPASRPSPPRSPPAPKAPSSMRKQYSALDKEVADLLVEIYGPGPNWPKKVLDTDIIKALGKRGKHVEIPTVRRARSIVRWSKR
jgi:hypothetical protein